MTGSPGPFPRKPGNLILLTFFLLPDPVIPKRSESFRQISTPSARNCFEKKANWMLPVVIVLGLVGGVIGAYLGKAILKKHFVKAGIV